jgi:hypothetical protein
VYLAHYYIHQHDLEGLTRSRSVADAQSRVYCERSGVGAAAQQRHEGD